MSSGRYNSHKFHDDSVEYGRSSRLSVISEKSHDHESLLFERDASVDESMSSFVEEEEVSEHESSKSSDVGGLLPCLERNFVVCILKDAINQLIIANSGEKNISLECLEKRKPMSERFNTPRRDNLMQVKTMERVDDVMRRMLMVKLRNDTSRLRKILSETCDEIDTNGTFTTLKYYVDEESQAENEEHQLIDDYVKNKHLLDFLGKRYKNDFDNHKQLCYELDSQIHELENEIHDIELENQIKKRLVEKWESSRHEQARVILTRKEQELNETYETAIHKRASEIEVMKEVKSFVQASIDALNSQIDYWIEKHEREVQKLDSDINTSNHRIAEIKTKTEELKLVFDARQIEINAYMIERQKKLAIKNFAQLQWNSAIKIQAWWRGCMVRAGLGQFRRKGKKPKKPKKAAGKGKKK